MSVLAIGIAEILVSVGTATFKFKCFNKGSVSYPQIGADQDLSGSWTRPTGTGSATATWSGADPTFTNVSGGPQQARILQVALTTGDGGGLCNIPFNEVALAAGDTIIFTSVLITFRTDAFPID